MKLQDLLEVQKDITGHVAKDGNKFYADRTDVETGKVILKPKEEISFKHNGKTMHAIVSKRAKGRDDDVYELDIVS